MNKTGTDAVQPEFLVERDGSGAGQRLVGETAGHENELSQPWMLRALPHPAPPQPQCSRVWVPTTPHPRLGLSLREMSLPTFPKPQPKSPVFSYLTYLSLGLSPL